MNNNKKRKVLSDIVEKMGGDPPPKITEEECLQQLTWLSDREYLCGAYWMFTILNNAIEEYDHMEVKLSLTKSKKEMEDMIKEFNVTLTKRKDI